MQNRLFIFLSFLITHQLLYSQPATTKLPEEFKVVVNESFGGSKLPKTIETASEGQWIISKGGKPGTTLKFIGKTQSETTNIKPITKAFIKGMGFNKFVFEASIEQCGRDYENRDVSIIFNFLDNNNYHFVHLASVAGEMSHGIFEVKDSVLTLLTTPSEEPLIWGVKQWFQVRLEQGIEPGVLMVFLNNNLLWKLNDVAEVAGRIGFGAPDGEAKIDNLKIWAPGTTVVAPLF
jgi:hypothetical protein